MSWNGGAAGLPHSALGAPGAPPVSHRNAARMPPPQPAPLDGGAAFPLPVATAMPRFFPPPGGASMLGLAGVPPPPAAAAAAAAAASAHWNAAAGGGIPSAAPDGQMGGDDDYGDEDDMSDGDDEDEDEGEEYDDDDDDEAGQGPDAIQSAPEAVVSAAYNEEAGHDTESYATDDEEEEGYEEGDDEGDDDGSSHRPDDAVGSVVVKTEGMPASPSEAGPPASRNRPTARASSRGGAGASTGGNKRSDQAWNRRLEELLRYKAEFGDALVPQKYERNKGLGEWVHRQRVQYRYLTQGQPSSLTPERIRALHDAGFAFIVRGSGGGSGRRSPKPRGGGGGSRKGRRGGTTTAASLSPLPSPSPAPSVASALSASSGVVDLTGDEDAATNMSSSRAPSRKRAPATKRKGKAPPKATSAAAARNEDTWNLRLEQLRRYHAEHGDFAVPRKFEANPQLGYWVNEQRKQIMFWVRGQPSTLTRERMGALFAMGFPLPRLSTNPNPALQSPVAVPGAGDAWNVRLNELREYRLEHGDYAVPRKFEKNPQLGYWRLLRGIDHFV